VGRDVAGTLVLVVGPSGAGKDTLIAAAREALSDDLGFVFPRRIVTREAVKELEDHDTINRENFVARRDEDGFALSWDAHGLSYALPKSILADLEAGRTVVANASRQVLGEAVARYGAQVVLVTADRAVRAARLSRRGRESEADVAARLAREGAALPPGVEATVIDNSADLGTAVTAFIAALRRF
jgi:ribose 1,5-bisphosphokinase